MRVSSSPSLPRPHALSLRIERDLSLLRCSDKPFFSCVSNSALPQGSQLIAAVPGCCLPCSAALPHCVVPSASSHAVPLDSYLGWKLLQMGELCLSLEGEARGSSAGRGARFPAQLGSNQRVKQETVSACSAWSLPQYFFLPSKPWLVAGAVSSAVALSGTSGSQCLELRLLPQPRPVGYKFLGPSKSLGASSREAGLHAGCLPSRWWESPALRAICPVGGV